MSEGRVKGLSDKKILILTKSEFCIYSKCYSLISSKGISLNLILIVLMVLNFFLKLAVVNNKYDKH